MCEWLSLGRALGDSQIVDLGWSQHSFAQTAVSQTRTNHLLPCLGSNHTTNKGRPHWWVVGKGPVGPPEAFWSPAFHLQGASHNCRQGAAAARSVSACNELPQKAPLPTSVPASLCGACFLGPTRGLPGPLCHPEAHPSRLATVCCTGSPNDAALRPGPYQPPRSVREREQVSPQWPRILASSSPFDPAVGGMRPPWHSGAPSRQLWGPGLDIHPSASLRAGPGRGGASVCAQRPGGAAPAPAARAGRAGEGRRLGSPLPRGAERPRSSAGGASFPRPLRLAPLFSPGPLRPAAEPRRPLGSARAAPPGPSNGGGRGCSRPDGALPHCQVRACPGARGRGSAKGQQGARSLRVSSEQCAPRLRACCRLPSPALYLCPFFPHTSLPLFSIFLSLDVSPLCQFAISAPCLSPQPFFLPLDLSFPISTSSLPFSSSTLVSPFLSLSPLFSRSPFLPLFLPAPLPFPLSCFPLYSFPPRPASLSGPRFPPGFPLPSGAEGLSGVCLLWGRTEAATATCRGSPPPPPRTEGGGGRGRGPHSSSHSEAPPSHPLSQNEVQAAWSEPCS